MSSSQTLAQATPSWDLADSSPHPALQPRTADAPPTTRDLEQAFDQLNPDHGIPADTYNPSGHQAMRDREAALALGTRVAVASSRENDRNPVMWLAGQDYRAADATRHARLQTVRQRYGPERVGPER
jgi:4-hydroxy-L-threonine phosphate dehydrogenase PdxA